MTPDQVDLVQTSWKKVQVIAATAAELSYAEARVEAYGLLSTTMKAAAA